MTNQPDIYKNVVHLDIPDLSAHINPQGFPLPAVLLKPDDDGDFAAQHILSFFDN